MSAKVLLYDIECAPLVAHVWGLRDQNVGLNQIVSDPEIIGVGYKWLDTGRAKYLSLLQLGRQEMLQQAWDLVDQADVIVGYNSVGFDNKWIFGEFARTGLTPPSPFKNIDLYRVVRSNFRLPSYKLQYVSKILGLEGKLETGGHDLWTRVMAGDEKADAKMARYCRRDVELLEPLLEKLRPWLPATVNFALYNGEELACQKCGSDDLESRGTAYTATRAYGQYRCRACGGWTRDNRSTHGTSVSGVAR